MLHRFASNAFANLVTGISATLFQIGVTAIAARSFGPDGFGLWALAMSIAAFVPLFSANLSTVLTRRLVEVSIEQRPIVFIVGGEFAKKLSGIAIVAILLVSIFLRPYSLPMQAASWVNNFVLVALLVMAQIWQVIMQPRFGWYYAKEQNWHVTSVVIFIRVGALTGMGLLCWLVPGQPQLAATCLLCGTAVGLALVINHHPAIGSQKPKSIEDVKHEQAFIKPLLKAFAIWSVCSAVIQYGSPLIISIIAPQNFEAFYLAYILNLIVVGTIAAAASALLAPLGRLRLSGETDKLQHYMKWAPGITGLILLIVIICMWYSLPALLGIWSPGVAPVEEVRRPLFWLAFQTIGRSMPLIYSVLLSSAGSPSHLRRPILFELGFTLVVALPAGFLFGDLGFLAALAVAGIFSAIYTVWLTLNLEVCHPKLRTGLFFSFIISLVLALNFWSFVS